jgi:hypothetical protein
LLQLISQKNANPFLSNLPVGILTHVCLLIVWQPMSGKRFILIVALNNGLKIWFFNNSLIL